MKKVYIIALHLAFGGVEKAIASMANIFAEKYDVEILCVYDMPGAPAYELDKRVRVTYLMRDIPNREQWKQAIRNKNIIGFIRESFRSVRILAGKKIAVFRAIRGITDGVVITTRHEDNLCLSRRGKAGVYKIAQLHHDHGFEKRYVRGFKRGYGNIDVLTVLTPGLADEVREMMKGSNEHTRVVYMPNFLDHYPENVSYNDRKKIVVAAGRLHPVKGFDRLIRCFASAHAKRDDWQLRIVGEGAERERLEKLITEYNAGDYITLCGEKNADGVREEMLEAGIYAMTSYSEGFGFVIIEAQSCGLPVISFDVRVGPGMLVHNGLDGVLIADGDESEFTEKLTELMDDAGMRKSMSVMAVRGAKEFYSENVARLWFDLIGG